MTGVVAQRRRPIRLVALGLAQRQALANVQRLRGGDQGLVGAANLAQAIGVVAQRRRPIRLVALRLAQRQALANVQRLLGGDQGLVGAANLAQVTGVVAQRHRQIWLIAIPIRLYQLAEKQSSLISTLKRALVIPVMP